MSLRCFPAAEQAATNDNGFERSSKALSSCQRFLVCNFWSMDADFLVPSHRASMLVNHAGNAHCRAVSSQDPFSWNASSSHWSFFLRVQETFFRVFLPQSSLRIWPTSKSNCEDLYASLLHGNGNAFVSWKEIAKSILYIGRCRYHVYVTFDVLVEDDERSRDEILTVQYSRL